MQKLLASLMTVSVSAMLLSACGGNSNSNTAPATDNAAASGAQTSANTTLPTKIVVGLDDNFPPMGFRDDKNELVGFDIDMARAAGAKMGIEMEFKPIDWSAKESELKSKRIDMLWNGLTITEERKKNIAFSKPYMENHQIIVVSANSAVKVKTDLNGKVVGVQDGSSAIPAIEADEISKSFKELKKYGDNVTALMDLGTKRIDAVVVDEVVGRYYVAKKPTEYVVLEDHFGTEEYGVGMRLEDTALQAKLQEALDGMKADGTSAKIANQWFGKDIVK